VCASIANLPLGFQEWSNGLRHGSRCLSASLPGETAIFSDKRYACSGIVAYYLTTGAQFILDEMEHLGAREPYAIL
jgi:hypothetical protein